MLPALARDLFEGGEDVGVYAMIAADADGAFAELQKVGFGSSGDEDPCAVSGEFGGSALADAAAAASDDGHLTL